MATNAKSTDDDTAEYTVAKRRTVTVGKTDGKATREEHFRDGAKVTLSISEGARLQKLGFLNQDDGSPPLITDEGPITAAGVEIQEQ